MKSAMARSKSPLAAPGEAAVGVGGGVFRIEPDRLVEVGDGAVVVALVALGDAAVGVGDGVFRIEPDRLVEVGDGAVVVALVVLGRGRGCRRRAAYFGSSRIASL